MRFATLDDSRCHLGEGPLWDVAEQALYWVDLPLLTGPVSMLVHDGFCGQAGWPA